MPSKTSLMKTEEKFKVNSDKVKTISRGWMNKRREVFSKNWSTYRL